MKSSTTLVVAVAVVSSVATVAAIELLRGSRPVGQPALAVEQPIATSAARALREVEALPPATQALDPLAGYEDRLAELERRLAALERAPTRQPASTASTSEELPPEEELRDLVLAWVAEDREALGRSEKLDAEAKERAERAFDARYQARMVALEHGLANWQEEKLAELYLEIGERTDEIEDSIDLSSADPAEIEARWVEFDEWAEQRERDVCSLVDPALYNKLFGED